MPPSLLCESPAKRFGKLSSVLGLQPYIGYLDVVILDQGLQIKSTEFSGLLSTAGVQKKRAEVESHNALGEAGRYHAYLRNVFEKVQSVHTGVAKETLLALAVKRIMAPLGRQESSTSFLFLVLFQGCRFIRKIYQIIVKE